LRVYFGLESSDENVEERPIRKNRMEVAIIGVRHEYTNIINMITIPNTLKKDKPQKNKNKNEKKPPSHK
jgi:hypothetical protein